MNRELCINLSFGNSYPLIVVTADEAYCYYHDDCPVIDIGNGELDLTETYCCRTVYSAGFCCDEEEYYYWEGGKEDVVPWIEA